MIKRERSSSGSSHSSEEIITGDAVEPRREAPAANTAALSGKPKGEPTDAQLFATLCEIDKYNYAYIYDKCKMYKINARQLRYLEKDHIRRIIPADQIGILAEFECLHSEWKRRFFERRSELSYGNRAAQNDFKPVMGVNRRTRLPPNHSESMSGEKNVHFDTLKSARLSGRPSASNVRAAAGGGNAPVATAKNLNVSGTLPTKPTKADLQKTAQSAEKKSSLKTHPQTDAKHEYPITDIIKNEVKNIQVQYKKNGFLVERDRRVMATALVEYFRSRNLYMSREIMDDLARQISEVFPTESKNAWHEITPNNRRRGRLCLKLYNMQRGTRGNDDRKRKLSDDEDDDDDDEQLDVKSTDLKQNGSLLPTDDDGEAKRIQVWLKKNQSDDIDAIDKMWYKTTHYRAKVMKRLCSDQTSRTGAHVDLFIDDWPAFLSYVGNTLVNIDFNFLYPKSEGVFHERWPLFLHRVEKLLKQEIKDSRSQELLTQFFTEENALLEDTKHAFLINMFHNAVRPHRMIHPRQNPRRFNVADSQAAFCKMISDTSEMDYYNEPFPFIFVMGSTFDVKTCYLAFKDIRFELSYVDAFLSCFQFFMVFRVHFPLAALNFWTFVQIFFFDISPDSKTIISIVEDLKNYLLAANRTES